MKFMKTVVAASAIMLSFSAGNASAQVSALPPGATNDLGVALFGTGLSAGATTTAHMLVPFVTATFTGTLESWVIGGDATNPYGGLTFVYRLSNSDVSSHSIERLTINGYNGFTAGVGYLAAGTLAPSTTVGGVAAGAVGVDLLPTLADRSVSLNPAVTGATVGFSFLESLTVPTIPPLVIPRPGNLAPGPVGFSNFTMHLAVYTNANNYLTTSANVIDGSTANPNTFAPSAIPEPETYAMMLAGLGLMGFVARRRKQTV